MGFEISFLSRTWTQSEFSSTIPEPKGGHSTQRTMHLPLKNLARLKPASVQRHFVCLRSADSGLAHCLALMMPLAALPGVRFSQAGSTPLDARNACVGELGVFVPRLGEAQLACSCLCPDVDTCRRVARAERERVLADQAEPSASRERDPNDGAFEVRKPPRRQISTWSRSTISKPHEHVTAAPRCRPLSEFPDDL